MKQEHWKDPGQVPVVIFKITAQINVLEMDTTGEFFGIHHCGIAVRLVSNSLF